MTEPFRWSLAKKHHSSARAARQLYTRTLDAMADVLAAEERRDFHRASAAGLGVELAPRKLAPEIPPELVDDARSAVSTQRWHEQRAGGQLWRFKNLEACGTRVRTARCGLCGIDGRTVLDGCGVSRLCAKCSLAKAKTRRARFGRARARCIVDGVKAGLVRQNRRGGAYSEKFLTLTSPHFEVDELDAHIADLTAAHRETRDPWYGKAARAAAELRKVGDTVKARVLAIWRAWPLFARAFRAFWKAREEGDRVAYFRAAEWTPGSDLQGHPHFHVWLWCPFLDATTVQRMWWDALESVGVPVPEGGPRIDVKRIYGFTNAMAVELLKGGRREALTLSRLQLSGAHDAGGVDAFSYCEGWTIAEVLDRAEDLSAPVVAALYEVLEGKRLTQASRGFFVEDERATCPYCAGGGHFSVRFEPRPEDGPGVATAAPRGERGPPHAERNPSAYDPSRPLRRDARAH